MNRMPVISQAVVIKIRLITQVNPKSLSSILSAETLSTSDTSSKHFLLSCFVFILFNFKMIDIDNIAKFNELKLSGKPTLMFFYAQWQDDSLNVDLKDLMSAMCSKYPQVEFCMVEAENVVELSEKFKISVVPTFVAICGNTTVGKVEGAAPADLSKLAKQLSTTPPQPLLSSKPPVPSAESTGSIESSIKNLINRGLFQVSVAYWNI